MEMKEFAINLDSEAKKPFYEQIYEAFRDAILEGQIACGEKLPSTRFEAEFLSCSRTTMELAYAQLLAEGYIESRPCRGYYVCDVQDLYHVPKSFLEKVEEEEPKDGGEEAPCRIDFSPNGIDLTPFPYTVLSRILKNKLIYEGEKLLERSDPFGEHELRKEIAAYLYRSRNVRCEFEQIVIGAGNEYLQMMLCQLLGPSHVAAMESPTYMKAYRTFQNLKIPVREIEIDHEGMCVDLLERSDADIAYVMPSHQFPLGTVMPMRRRLELLKWANDREERYIIEDDYDSEFRYKGKPVPSLQGMDNAQKVIYLGTFSRSIAPSLRVSYMVLPRHLMRRYRETCGFYSCTVPTIMQHAICEFMREGYFEKNLNRMRGIYKSRHDVLLAELKNSSWVNWIIGENSGLHLVVEIKTHLGEHEISELCRKKGIRMYGLSECFMHGKPTFPYPVFLFGYGGLREEQIREGIHDISELFA